jgi:hypothetical protein
VLAAFLSLRTGELRYFCGEGDTVEELGDLFRSVDLVVEAVYVDHLEV